MKDNLLNVFEKRRSIYALGHNISISISVINSLIEQCVKNAPSAFNSQGGRIVVLYGQEHQNLWNTIVHDTLQKITPADKFLSTQNKLTSFAQAFGTILFFEDWQTVASLQKNYPLYKESFPAFSCQSSGMLQFMVWSVLAEHNIGASLQHYNPLIDTLVQKQWNLPQEWHLMSQMPFGNIEKLPSAKSYIPLEDRIKIFK